MSNKVSFLIIIKGYVPAVRCYSGSKKPCRRADFTTSAPGVWNPGALWRTSLKHPGSNRAQHSLDKIILFD